MTGPPAHRSPVEAHVKAQADVDPCYCRICSDNPEEIRESYELHVALRMAAAVVKKSTLKVFDMAIEMLAKPEEGNRSMAIASNFVMIIAPLILVSALLVVSVFIVHLQRVKTQEAHAAARRLHLFTLEKHVRHDRSSESSVDGSCVRMETAQPFFR